MYDTPFQPINSTDPGFSSTLGSSGVYAIETTGTRIFPTPASRAIRLASVANTPFTFKLGSSAITVASSDGVGTLVNSPEVFGIRPGQTHIAIKSSTDVAVNVVLGTGMR